LSFGLLIYQSERVKDTNTKFESHYDAIIADNTVSHLDQAWHFFPFLGESNHKGSILDMMPIDEMIQGHPMALEFTASQYTKELMVYSTPELTAASSTDSMIGVTVDLPSWIDICR
jgi:hypothetical protein